MKDGSYSIISLIITLIIPTVIYFVRKKKEDSKTSKTVAVKYFFFFFCSIILAILSYLLWQNMYLSIGLLFSLGVLGLIFLIYMQNKEKKDVINRK